MENGGKMNELIPSNSPITQDLYVRFIEFLDAKPKTIATYTRALRQFFTFLSSKSISRPTREDVIAFRDELQLGHKPTTVQNYLAVAKLFFRWTAKEGIYPNVADHIKGVKLSKEHKKDYLTSAQVKATLSKIDRNTVQGLRDYAILLLMITGGLRDVEVMRANIEDLRTRGDAPVLYIQGKGRNEKEDYVKLSPQVEAAIEDYLEARGTTDDEAPLFASLSNNSKGSRLTTRSISGIVKTRLQNAGYDSERLTAHSLRHTAVTLALLGGQDLAEVQQFARHANITTTQIYNHAIDRAKNSCSGVISRAIFS